jgi:outer membrane lipoprotein SlyB
MNSTDPNPTPHRHRRLHPLVATAVAAVIVASLAATAAITGVFPKASSTSALNDQTQAATIATQPVTQQGTAPSAPQAPGAVAPPQQAPQPTQYAQQPPPAETSSCPATCGTVESVYAVHHEGHGTGIGAVGGAVAGGVIGNQFGRGGGRMGMTLLGALGGGLGGNAIEKHMRSTTSYSVRVHMENGRTRYFTYREPPPFQRGEHVHLQNGTLAAG